MKILCCSCGKNIKLKRGYQLRCCVKCGLPVCPSCTVKSHCNACLPSNRPEVLVYDYFKEKYKVLSVPS